MSGLGVSEPVLGEPALKLTGLSPPLLPPPTTGDPGVWEWASGWWAWLWLCASGDGTGVNDAGGGFHDARWKLFFLRTLALYAARIAAVASFVRLNTLETLAAVEGTVDATLGARECGPDEVCSSSRGGNPADVGETGAGSGSRAGEKFGEGNDDSQLSYWLVEPDDELGATLGKRWWGW